MSRGLSIPGFDGFGPCRQAGDREPASVEVDLPAADKAAREILRDACPASPGVYGMVDVEGRLIYVGKSKTLRDRLLTYFTSSSAPSKARRIAERARRLIWEPAPHEFAALLRELELIRRWRPQLNIQGQPRRQRKAYVCLGRGPATKAFLTATPSGRNGLVFGPLRAGRRWRAVVRRLNDCFQLRDCAERRSTVFADQLELFRNDRAPGCMRRDLGTCLGPCAAACSRGDYDDRVGAARAFLRGGDLSMLKRLEETMWQASAAGNYEYAALLRDTHDDLRALHEQLKRLRRVRRRYRFVYPLPGYQDTTQWYVIDRGHLADVVPAPTDGQTALECNRALEAAYGGNTLHRPSGIPEDLDLVLLVAGWFQRNREELRQTIAPKDAREMCQGYLT